LPSSKKSTHIYNLVPSLPDHRDVVMQVMHHPGLPADMEIPSLPEIKDQGREGSCTGFSLSTAREIRGRQTVWPDAVFSPAFIYYQERVIEKQTHFDSGAMIRDGLKVLRHQGVCLESDMPYRAGDFETAPEKAAITDAKQYVISQYASVRGIFSAQQALVNLQPVIFGIAVYESFEEVGPDGMVPMPKPSEAMLGGHAICAVGYHADATIPGGGYFDLMNSWGKGAGKGGHYYLPFAYVMSHDYTFDHWTFM
jgi:C1A family cysteine protease